MKITIKLFAFGLLIFTFLIGSCSNAEMLTILTDFGVDCNQDKTAFTN